jgi:hypothetical protein
MLESEARTERPHDGNGQCLQECFGHDRRYPLAMNRARQAAITTENFRDCQRRRGALGKAGLTVSAYPKKGGTISY